MKKFIMAFGVVALIAGTTSCKKDYTCECTSATQGAVGTITLEYKKVKKKDAEDGCASAQTTYQIASADYTCVLK